MGSSQQTAQADHQMEQDVNRREEHGSVCSCSGAGMQACESPSRFYEGLLSASRTSTTPVPLAAALALCPGLEGDVVKQGYLGKLERNQRRYFVLRTGSHTGPSRLEWFKTQEKFKTVEKMDGKTSLFGSRKQSDQVIYLRCCLGVRRIANSRKGHIVALYAKDRTMVLVAEDQEEQEEWYVAIKKIIEEERKYEEGLDEEDDGYCTLSPVAVFKEVWPVTVKPRGLGRTKSLAGETRLCLSATSLVLVRVGADDELPSVTVPLLSVRRFGHSESLFYLELGRSAPTGPGEIWMDAGDHGDTTLAQHMHDTLREMMRALRALPDFRQSPASNYNHQNQTRALLASKRGRPKYKDKVGPVRPLASPLSSPSRNPGQHEIPASVTQLYLEPRAPEKIEPAPALRFNSNPTSFRSRQSSMSDTGSYMEMMVHSHLPADKVMEDQHGSMSAVTEEHCSVPAGRMETWEAGEAQGSPGYMMMSPQKGHYCSDLPHSDYVTMASPPIHTWPARSSYSSSLQMSFNSSTSYNSLPLHQSNQTAESSQIDWLASGVQPSESETNQLEMLSCSPLAKSNAGLEEEAANCRHLQEQVMPASYMLKIVLASGLPTPNPIIGPGSSQPVQTYPVHLSTDRYNPAHAVPDQSAAQRYWLSSCLPCCLQAED
ncbi:insulin receptor substrate 1-like [Myripristis murdjan]|uniref:Insulin receptor substrate 1-like n=1 Tax=Myripristis murdjan TaxID=586833 RepID=A0A667YQX2_9TELE|nr:insulin receptor substrate 1-like [Myripristis murdjan]XP_029922908.1 insulin receptor substrate 1-like [Myripristis murdjan]